MPDPLGGHGDFQQDGHSLWQCRCEQKPQGMESNSGITFKSYIFSVVLLFINGLLGNALFSNAFFDDVLFGNVMVTIDRRTVELAVSDIITI